MHADRGSRLFDDRLHPGGSSLRSVHGRTSALQNTYRESEQADLGVLRDSRRSVGRENGSNRAHKGGDGGANHDDSWKLNEELGIGGWVAESKRREFAGACFLDYILLHGENLLHG
jgi:hypothetical protein